MTNPADDLSHIADPGSMDPATMTEPDTGDGADLDYDHRDLAAPARGSGTPGEAPDSATALGSPAGPPD